MINKCFVFIRQIVMFFQNQNIQTYTKNSFFHKRQHCIANQIISRKLILTLELRRDKVSC